MRVEFSCNSQSLSKSPGGKFPNFQTGSKQSEGREVSTTRRPENEQIMDF